MYRKLKGSILDRAYMIASRQREHKVLIKKILSISCQLITVGLPTRGGVYKAEKTWGLETGANNS